MSRATDTAREQRDIALLELDYQRAEAERLSAELFKLLGRSDED